ncbi:hypothetical protein E2C01_042736 [Portunus trituberculatus]|uniref:Uncharacterized protein n=1 Tax=Portunus trituberculatus TaxID=210409 RepID=A0A5B7FUE8_PORTR|nr:hypothetical protein [Portunus trituberculatus]
MLRTDGDGRGGDHDGGDRKTEQGDNANDDDQDVHCHNDDCGERFMNTTVHSSLLGSHLQASPSVHNGRSWISGDIS